LNLVEDYAPDLVAVFGADHIYRMDVSEMIRVHCEREADVTVAALPVPLHAATGFGIIEVNRDGRIVGFEEKPKHPKPMPNDPEQAYSSMGNYVFETDLLRGVLEQDAARPGSHDFGRDILPRLIASHRVMAYNFLDNAVPGLKPYEERGYWRDVGTLDAFWQAHMDLLGESPIFDLRNSKWPILTDTFDGPTASLVRSHVDDSMIGQGSQVIEAEIRGCVIGRNVRIEAGARLDGCVIFDGVHIGAKAKLRRVIADRFNVISAGTEMGYDRGEDRKRGHITKSGLVVLPRGHAARGVTKPAHLA
jgi:glucose-1-phosphate adenylyltransferase